MPAVRGDVHDQKSRISKQGHGRLTKPCVNIPFGPVKAQSCHSLRFEVSRIFFLKKYIFQLGKCIFITQLKYFL